MRTEDVILSNLLNHEQYTRRVIPFIDENYFHSKEDKTTFEEVREFILKYNHLPSVEALHLSIKERTDLNESEFESIKKLIETISPKQEQHEEWLVETTEKWCQEKAIYNGIMESIKILDGKSNKNKHLIPDILTKALGVNFDNSVGHDYLLDFNLRFEYYHQKSMHIPFDVEYFNKITRGGVIPKTLNILVAGTGVGKSMFLCHFAANYLLQNKNVLYISCEMSEEELAARIDANLMGISIDDVKEIPKKLYDEKAEEIKKKCTGNLIIKQYPPTTASASHFRHLLDELSLKRKFWPDVIIIDYINICSSSRLKPGGANNSFTLIKSIAEELRGLAVEKEVPIWTATQTNREGMENSDFGSKNISESIGIAYTADLMVGLIRTEELDNLGQVMVKQLKNRYADENLYKRFIVGLDRSKAKVFNVSNQATEELMKEEAADHGTEIQKFERGLVGSKKSNNKNFEDFRF